MTRIVGVDPGSRTGLVAIDLPGSLDLSKARWIDNVIVTKKDDRQFFAKLLMFFEKHEPEIVAMEDPWDQDASWRRGRAVGTNYRLGWSAGLAYASLPATSRVTKYPVRGTRKDPGWMAKKYIGGVERGTMERAACRTVQDSPDWDDLSEHERAAFGVLIHHIGQAGEFTNL